MNSILRRLQWWPAGFALLTLLIFPATNVLAYSQTVRDDGNANPTYFHADSGWNLNPGVGQGWWNGYDYDTYVLLTNGGNSAAYWKPYPSPSPYFMCPYAHISNASTWSETTATYSIDDAQAWVNAPVHVSQQYNLNNWVNVTQGGGYDKFYSPSSGIDYQELVADDINTPSGKHISADAMAFHYNPNNVNDASCS